MSMSLRPYLTSFNSAPPQPEIKSRVEYLSTLEMTWKTQLKLKAYNILLAVNKDIVFFIGLIYAVDSYKFGF